MSLIGDHSYEWFRGGDGIVYGPGVPDNVDNAAKGTLKIRSDGPPFLYVNTDGDVAWAEVATAALVDTGVRRVATTGADTNDGLSWESAFLTVEAAIADLPSKGSGGSLRQVGTVLIAEGEYFENNPLEVNADIQFIGAGPGLADAGGTVVRGNNNDHLFSFTGTFTDWAHNVTFANMRLDGQDITGDFDLLRTYRPGFNHVIDNVHFKAHPRTGLHIERNCINSRITNCTWSIGSGDCIYFYMNGGIVNLQIHNSQADKFGGVFLFVEHISNAGGAMIEIDGLKIESHDEGLVPRVVTFKPRTSAGGNPPHFSLLNINAAHNGTGGGEAGIVEEDGAGIAASWHIRHCWFRDYSNGFKSYKTGQVSNSEEIRLANFSEQESFNIDSASFGLKGVNVDVGSGSPENNLGRKLGSVYLRTDTDPYLYIKTSDQPTASQGTLTMDTEPSDGDTYTVDYKTYTFQTSLTDTDGNVAIGGSLAQAKLNLVAAFDLSGTAGTDYATSMNRHTTVDVATFISDDAVLTAKRVGVPGDSLATTETFTAGTNVFDAATLGTTTAGDNGITGWLAALPPPSHTNANRPAATAVPAGYMIFNTDDGGTGAGAPNWSDGTNWVDATGATT